MRVLTSESVGAFVAAKPAAALHFDAGWNAKYREQVRRSMLEAEAALGERANFAEIDCDANEDLSKSIPVLNVPLVAYYCGGKLVAALIGADQNVRARVERVLRGEMIGDKDGTAPPPNPPMKQTGAAGMLSAVRKLLPGRGSGR
jgi:thioredoxin-like negative regulator of GroEL